VSENTDLTFIYPILAHVAAGLRERIQREMIYLTIPGNSVLFDESQACKGFPFVLKGRIRVVKPAANGRELRLYQVEPGETCIISCSCLVGHTDYNARGVTESEVRLALMPAALFHDLLGEVPFRDFVFRLFSERIADLMQLVQAVAFQKLDQRLASSLLGHGRTVYATHQQLADELGSIREIVTRLLKGFAEQGWVRLGRERIEILLPAELRRLAGSDVVQ
jgi:CRP/FNR family transcriptional regulator